MAAASCLAEGPVSGILRTGPAMDESSGCTVMTVLPGENPSAVRPWEPRAFGSAWAASNDQAGDGSLIPLICRGHERGCAARKASVAGLVAAAAGVEQSQLGYHPVNGVEYR